MAEKRLTGYRRPDGRVGIRNHVLILPVDDLSNAAAESVARAIPGTLALPHPYGRLQFGADLDLFFQTLIGTGAREALNRASTVGGGSMVGGDMGHQESRYRAATSRTVAE